MATQRPIPESYYYSGQGRLGIGDRDPSTGALENVVFVGNVTQLTVNIETTKFEHKESMSGQRAIDLTFTQEKKATFQFIAESLTLRLLALGLYGAQATQAGGVIASEAHIATRGAAIPLKNPNVSSVVITRTTGAVVLVENTDYVIDEGFGTIYINPTSSVITAPNTPVTVNYTHAGHDVLQAFTQAVPPEKYIRFEGLNTVNGDLRLIDIPRGAFDPLTGLEFINEELGSGEFNGSILPDLTITDASKSQFFTERRIYGTGAVGGTVPAPAAAVLNDADDDALVLTFTRALTSANPAGAGGFVVNASGAVVTVTGVVITGAVVTLALSRAIAANEVVAVSYTPPGTNNLANASGLVAAFTNFDVENNVV